MWVGATQVGQRYTPAPDRVCPEPSTGLHARFKGSATNSPAWVLVLVVAEAHSRSTGSAGPIGPPLHEGAWHCHWDARQTPLLCTPCFYTQQQQVGPEASRPSLWETAGHVYDMRTVSCVLCGCPPLERPHAVQARTPTPALCVHGILCVQARAALQPAGAVHGGLQLYLRGGGQHAWSQAASGQSQRSIRAGSRHGHGGGGRGGKTCQAAAAAGL